MTWSGLYESRLPGRKSRRVRKSKRYQNLDYKMISSRITKKNIKRYKKLENFVIFYFIILRI